MYGIDCPLEALEKKVSLTFLSSRNKEQRFQDLFEFSFRSVNHHYLSGLRFFFSHPPPPSSPDFFFSPPFFPPYASALLCLYFSEQNSESVFTVYTHLTGGEGEEKKMWNFRKTNCWKKRNDIAKKSVYNHHDGEERKKKSFYPVYRRWIHKHF